MKKTKKFAIWPMNLGLDLTSIPGTQQPGALRRAKNVSLSTIPSIRKMPGLSRLTYTGHDDGVQGAVQFNAVVGGAKRSEVVRVRNGEVEALRDPDGGTPTFMPIQIEDEDGNLSNVDANPTDKVTFEQFSSALLIAFENRSPLYYRLGGNLTDLPIRSTHADTPPAFFRKHDFRLWYAGVGNDPDRGFVSAVNNIFDYTLLGGGFAIRYDDGDGDPVGLTGFSPTFRGDLYAYKWNAIYRTFRSEYGYGIDPITNEAGAVSQNCILATQNDVYSVDAGGFRSLAVTDKYGAAEETTLTWPIYEYFQRNVNWSAYKNFNLGYDKSSATLLFSYTSIFSSVNDRILGMNLRTQQFFEWQDQGFVTTSRYFDFGRQKTMVHVDGVGTAILDNDVHTIAGQPINMDIETGPVFPFGDPKAEFNLVQGWILARPTTKSVIIDIDYRIDGKEPISTSVDTLGLGYGAVISTEDVGGVIGVDNIGKMPTDLVMLWFKCQGNGHSVQFRLRQEPPDADPNQPCEIFGILYEVEYNEDSDIKSAI